MNRKLELLACEPDLDILHVSPRRWQDQFGQVEQTSTMEGSYRRIAVPMIGRPDDPHRALYQTLCFGMNRFRPDVVHAEEEPDSLAALQAALAQRVAAPRAKLLLYTWQNIDRPKRWYVRSVLRVTLSASDAVFCASQEAVDVLRQQGYRKLVRVLVSMGVDTGTFVPCQRPTRDPQTFVVGYVGRLVPEKGVDLLISAIARWKRSDDRTRKSVAQPELRIVGGGPDRSRLEALVQRRGMAERVRFIAPMRPAQVAQYLCELDVLVLPSLSTPVWKEQFGRVLVEAMACGIPVIGAKSGAIPEVVGDAGLVFPEGDEKGLSKCIHRLIESRELRNELSERGYARASSLYSQERIAQQTAEFYRWVLA